MAAPTLWVPSDTHRQAEALMTKGTRRGGCDGALVREAVEMVLKADQGVQPASAGNIVDAGRLLQKGLTVLNNNPYEALGLDLKAGTIDVKKAFRKMALKYHPDKNPKTTPLFQAISHAQERLSDTSTRKKEEVKKKSQAPFNPPQAPTSARSAYTNSNANAGYQQQGSQQSRASKADGPNKTYEKRYEQAQQQRQRQQEWQKQYEGYSNAYYNKKAPVDSDEEAEADIRAFRERKRASERREADAKAKNEAYRKAYDKRAQREANEANARAKREAEMRANQRAYAEEMRRRREAASGRSRPAYTAEPTPTPDSTNPQKKKPSSQYSANYSSSDARSARSNENTGPNLRGYRADNNSNASKGVPGGVGQTFTVDGKGKVNNNGGTETRGEAAGRSAYRFAEAQYKSGFSSQSNSAASNAYPNYNKKTPSVNAHMYMPPRPYALQTVAVGATSCEVLWKVSLDKDNKMKNGNVVSYEFQWRLLSMGAVLGNRGGALAPWQTATKFVKTKQIRKKNLKTGGVYEFRVRTVEELPSKMLGERSEWCDSLKVMLKAQDFVPESKPTSATDNPDTSRGTYDRSAKDSARDSKATSNARPGSAARVNRAFVDSQSTKMYESIPKQSTIRHDNEDIRAARVRAAEERAAANKTNDKQDAADSKSTASNDDAPSKSSKVRRNRDGKTIHQLEEEFELSDDTKSNEDRDDDEDEIEIEAEESDSDYDDDDDEEDYDFAEFGEDEDMQAFYAGFADQLNMNGGPLTGNKGANASNSAYGNNSSAKPDANEDDGDWDEGGVIEWYDLHPPADQMVTYVHEVYEIPSVSSKKVGLLSPGTAVQGRQPPAAVLSKYRNLGDTWLFCKYHRTPSSSTRDTLNANTSNNSGSEWGWALKKKGSHIFLAKAVSDGFDDAAYEESPSTGPGPVSNDSDWDEEQDIDYSTGARYHTDGSVEYNGKRYVYHETDCDVWCEYYDDEGNQYFVNERTHESSWEAPSWVEETDPNSGAKYYVKLDPVGANPLHSTWSRPEAFAKIRRLQPEDWLSEEEEAEEEK